MSRPGRLEDAHAIAVVYLASWQQSSSALLNGRPNSAANVVGPEALAAQQERFENFLRSGQRHFVVVEAPRQNSDESNTPAPLCGFCSYAPSYTKPGMGEVMQLFVHPDWQRIGIGTELLTAAWGDMMAQPWACDGLHVWCTKANAGNAVYSKLGWIVSGREKEIMPTMSTEPVAVVEFVAPVGVSPPPPRPLKTNLAKYPPSGQANSPGPPRGAGLTWFWCSCLLAFTAVLLSVVRSWRSDIVGQDKNVGFRVRLANDTFGVAHCLDGSAPVYYHRRGVASGQGAHKWLLYFQGGGFCLPGSGSSQFPPSLLDSCDQRSQRHKGSTARDEEEMSFGPKQLFSRDPAQNPPFHDWHVVFLRYCDGASFASSAGKAMFEAILNDLLGKGMSLASDVVVSGCSAGAIAAAVHVDRVQRVLPNALVTGLLDSGLFLDWSRKGEAAEASLSWRNPASVWLVGPELQRLFVEHQLQAAGAIPVACLEAHKAAPWRCFFLEYLLPFVEAPVFVLQSRFDASNIASINRPEDLHALGTVAERRLTQALESNGLPWRNHSPHGLFVDSCFHHCMSWGQLNAAGGATQPEAFLKWRRGPATQSWRRWRQTLPVETVGHVAASQEGEQPTAAGAFEERRVWDHNCDDSKQLCWRKDHCPQVDEDMEFWKRNFRQEVVDISLGKAA